MSSLPKECAIAFKEWSEICQVLADGRQTLIVRKGGIREGPGEFSPDYPAFWLYPTFVHQAQQGLRAPLNDQPAEPRSPTDRVSIRALALVERLWQVRSEHELPALTPFHHWTPETLRARFFYRHPGLWVLGVRVFVQNESWTLLPTPGQLGCKSWVVLDAPVSTALLRPVHDDAGWSVQMDNLCAALGQPSQVE